MGLIDGAQPLEWVEEGNRKLVSNLGVVKRKWRPRKKEFNGWASKQLVHFLMSIGKMSSVALSQRDVTSIVDHYVAENKLINPLKKKRVICDDKLWALFGRKTIGRNNVNDLLESHLAENQDDSAGNAVYNSEEEKQVHVSDKKQKTSCSYEKTQSKTSIYPVPDSSFAAIKAENIKLVHLKRNLVQNLLNDLENFETKLVGSFVRVKSDPLDYLQKNSHQLQLVTGLKKLANANTDRPEILLQISDMAKDVKISELSDDNFTEDECHDLGQKIEDGILKRITVAELQNKAQLLHEDTTKNWLEREIHRVQRLIDQANEKGWRRELSGYRERKKLLQTPSEQTRLLNEVPRVIAEDIRPDIDSQWKIPNLCTKTSSAKNLNGEGCTSFDSPQVFFSESPEERFQADATGNNNQPQPSTQSTPSLLQSVPMSSTEQEHVVIDLTGDDDDENQGIERSHDTSLDDKVWVYMDPSYCVQGPFSMFTLAYWSSQGFFPEEFIVWKIHEGASEAVLLTEVLRQMFSCR